MSSCTEEEEVATCILFEIEAHSAASTDRDVVRPCENEQRRIVGMPLVCLELGIELEEEALAIGPPRVLLPPAFTHIRTKHLQHLTCQYDTHTKLQNNNNNNNVVLPTTNHPRRTCPFVSSTNRSEHSVQAVR